MYTAYKFDFDTLYIVDLDSFMTVSLKGLLERHQRLIRIV